MLKPLDLTFRRLIREGSLDVVDSGGTRHRYGDGTGEPVAIRLCDRKLERMLVVDPELAAGEAYMQGRLTIESGDAYAFLSLVMTNLARRPLPGWSRTLAAARRATRQLNQYNPRGRAMRNAQRHYDLDPRIYDLFLDPERQYSCAYFDGALSLEEAQRAKMRHIAAKLVLEPGQRVLDIGSGWGGLARYLALAADVHVDGITLSREQLERSRRDASRIGLSSRVGFELKDYRDVERQYDRIVSVGMLEHVGVPHYPAFFGVLARCLCENGVALVHAICRSDDAGGTTNPFIAKHIFPGGYIPALSEVLPAIEQSGLLVTDIELLRLHYAETLRAWRSRFLANRDEARRIAGEEFCRMWEFYLAGSEAAFRHQGLMVFQIQLARRVDTLPLTRAYIERAERTLAEREVGQATGGAARSRA